MHIYGIYSIFHEYEHTPVPVMNSREYIQYVSQQRSRGRSRVLKSSTTKMFSPLLLRIAFCSYPIIKKTHRYIILHMIRQVYGGVLCKMCFYLSRNVITFPLYYRIVIVSEQLLVKCTAEFAPHSCLFGMWLSHLHSGFIEQNVCNVIR